jgi:hypothetical protein
VSPLAAVVLKQSDNSRGQTNTPLLTRSATCCCPYDPLCRSARS